MTDCSASTMGTPIILSARRGSSSVAAAGCIAPCLISTLVEVGVEAGGLGRGATAATGAGSADEKGALLGVLRNQLPKIMPPPRVAEAISVRTNMKRSQYARGASDPCRQRPPN